MKVGLRPGARLGLFTGACLLYFLSLSYLAFAQENIDTDARVETASIGALTKVAPGELLPFAVKLLNFGAKNRVDVLVRYSIFASGSEEIAAVEETLAVETTASFVKEIRIPFGAAPGTYAVKTSIAYEGQLVPATSQFSFAVERKILGIFQGRFLLYGAATLLVSLLTLSAGHAWIRRSRLARLAPLDYSNVPRRERPFYEILSDTVLQMRQRVGEDALFIAARIQGMKIDMRTGRILAVTESPAKIVATLISEYEKLLGKKVSFSLRKGKSES